MSRKVLSLSLTLLLALFLVPAQPVQAQGLTLRLDNVTIDPGDVLAPHLYDWSFDGVDDYVETSPNITTGVVTYAVWVYIDINQPNWFPAIMGTKYWNTEGGVSLLWNDDSYKLDLGWINVTTGAVNHLTYPCDPKGAWHFVVGQVDGVNLYAELYLDGNLVASMTATTDFTWSSEIQIAKAWGVHYLKGRISSVSIYNRTLDSAEIGDAYNSHVINATGMVLFLDATFYNGTHYLDLSPYGNHGTPYGVARVSAENKWLWLVKGLEGDDKVHFKFFPVGTTVRIYDSSRSLVASFTVDSYDYSISLASGTYTVEATVDSAGYGFTYYILNSDPVLLDFSQLISENYVYPDLRDVNTTASQVYKWNGTSNLLVVENATVYLGSHPGVDNVYQELYWNRKRDDYSNVTVGYSLEHVVIGSGALWGSLESTYYVDGSSIRLKVYRPSSGVAKSLAEIQMLLPTPLLDNATFKIRFKCYYYGGTKGYFYIYLYNWDTGSYDLIKYYDLYYGDPPSDTWTTYTYTISIPGSYVGPDGKVKVRVGPAIDSGSTYDYVDGYVDYVGLEHQPLTYPTVSVSTGKLIQLNLFYKVSVLDEKDYSPFNVSGYEAYLESDLWTYNVTGFNTFHFASGKEPLYLKYRLGSQVYRTLIPNAEELSFYVSREPQAQIVFKAPTAIEDPTTAYVRVDDGSKVVHESWFDFTGQTTAYLTLNKNYRISMVLQDQVISYGWYTVAGADLIELPYRLNPVLKRYYKPISAKAFISNGEVHVAYEDLENQTDYVDLYFYNASMSLLYQDVGVTVQDKTQLYYRLNATAQGFNASDVEYVKIVAYRGSTFKVVAPVSGLEEGSAWTHLPSAAGAATKWVALALIVGTALAFTMLHAPAGALAVMGVASVTVMVGWLDVPAEILGLGWTVAVIGLLVERGRQQ